MKLEQATLALRPRTLPQCLDLALVMLRAHGIPLLKLWAIVAIPVCTLVYLGVYYVGFTLRLGIIAFLVATVPLGMLMVSAAAPSAFGEKPTVRGTFRNLGAGGGIALLLKLYGYRFFSLLGLFLLLIPSAWMVVLGLLLLLFPGIWIAARTGFVTEQAVLSGLDDRLYDHRTEELLKGELFDLIIRGAVIVGYCFLLLILLFATCDVVGWSLSFPILVGRIQEGIDPQYYNGWEMLKAAWLYLTADPLVVTTLLAVALAVYPVGRLAWLLCYIDLRVRRDCWDMEVSILNEARRLEET